MARKSDFDLAVPLPPGLEIAAIRKSIDYLERELGELVEMAGRTRSACATPRRSSATRRCAGVRT